MMGTRTPNFCRQSAILGTAAAACSVLTVTRTSSEPAAASAITWFTVEVTSAVSVLVIDCTTMGCEPPTFTPFTSTTVVRRRLITAIHPPGKFHSSRGPQFPSLKGGLGVAEASGSRTHLRHKVPHD